MSQRRNFVIVVALSLTLFLVLIVLTIVQFRVSRRWVHYD